MAQSCWRGLISLVLLAGALLAAEPADNTHWSFRPLARPVAPAAKDASWPKGDLDRIVAAKLSAAELSPNPDADRTVLLRRLAYDLTGLPPTEAEVAEFLADKSPDDQALARVVDRYLNSPRFGERWGRHWLDVARYADNTGRVWNAPLTYAWRYRDYVIDAFSKDKPFDRFIAEQLAGDLLPAKSVAEERENRIATGFLALGAHDLQTLNHEQFVLDEIDDQIDVTTRAFLGLSVACARSHDHK